MIWQYLDDVCEDVPVIELRGFPIMSDWVTK